MAAKKWPNSKALHSILFFFLSSIEERKKKRIERRGELHRRFFWSHGLSTCAIRTNHFFASSIEDRQPITHSHSTRAYMDDYKCLGVKARRAYLDMNDEHWACERSGQTTEDGLAMYTTGRRTRSDPQGKRIVCLCGDCAIMCDSKDSLVVSS